MLCSKWFSARLHIKDCDVTEVEGRRWLRVGDQIWCALRPVTPNPLPMPPLWKKVMRRSPCSAIRSWGHGSPKDCKTLTHSCSTPLWAVGKSPFLSLRVAFSEGSLVGRKFTPFPEKANTRCRFHFNWCLSCRYESFCSAHNGKEEQLAKRIADSRTVIQCQPILSSCLTSGHQHFLFEPYGPFLSSY